MNRHVLLAVLGTPTLACCVAEGTMIATPRGLRAVESLRVGDAVYSVDVETGARIEVAITAIRSAARECVGIELAGGERLRCTSDHPIFDPVGGVYRPAGDWVMQPGRALLRLTTQLERRSPTAASAFVGLLRVFDLTVGGEHHNFLASGVVVHNKSLAFEVDDEVDDTEACWGDDDDDEEVFWFDEIEANPCERPLPPGAGCLVIGGTQFHLGGGTASIVGTEYGDVLEIEFPDSPTVVFHHHQFLTGESECSWISSSFRIDFDEHTLREDSCVWTLGDTPAVPGGVARGSASGNLEVEGEAGLWTFTMEWNAVPVAP